MAKEVADWSPPLFHGKFGAKARIVTQADVDRWVRIESSYGELVKLVGEMRGILNYTEKDLALLAE